MLRAFEETEEPFFLMLARSFLGRIENDLYYRGGTDEQITAVMDRHLFAAQKLETLRPENKALHHAFDRYSESARENFFQYLFNYHANATGGRRAELLKNAAYVGVLEKYK